MKANRLMWAVIVCLFAGIELWGQQPNTLSEGLGSNPSNTLNVPRLIKFSGVMKDFTGKPLMGPVDINFAIYKEQTDAEPVWQEMQTLQLDEQGRYTVLLGAMQPEGLPMGLFSSGEARWLEVNAAGTEAQPRTLLVSVPYALKASDAETLGGKPASAYLLAPLNQTGSGTTQGTKGSSTAATGNTTILTPAVITPSVTYGTANYIPVFTDNAGDMGNSTMYQLGTQVGIATTTPGTLNGHYFPSLLLDAAQATASTYLTADTELQGGYAGVLLNRGAATANNRDWAIENQPDSTLTSSQFAISTYNDAGYPTAMLMVTRSGLVGIGTTTPGATLEVNGTGKFDGSVAVGGLAAGNCVQAGAGGLLTTTASPCGSGGGGGGGTITGVTAGTDLTGGGTSGNVTLNLDTTKVPTLGANTFTGNQTINNGELYASSAANGVWGTTSNGSDVGVAGVNTSTTGNAYGVYGFSGSSTGYGVYGGGGYAGVLGISNASIGSIGVYGYNPATSGIGYGVVGMSASSSGWGVYGDNTATTGGWGVVGASGSSAGTGVYGYNIATTGNAYAVVGASSSSAGTGVLGLSSKGVESNAHPSGLLYHGGGEFSGPNGLIGAASSDYFDGFGVIGIASGSSGRGVEGDYVGTGAGYAGYFIGNVYVNGTLSKAAGSFKINHPLDPANKYLVHSFVESPDMKNVYDGVAVLDANGEAWVGLPEYFETLNSDFRYQLTAIKAPAPGLYIAEEISGNRFKIAGGKPGGKVSWQVTGIRQDAYAKAHRIQVEEAKPVAERGLYLHPELFGQPTEKGIDWARQPHLMPPPESGAKLPKPPEPAKLPAPPKPPHQ